MSNETVRGADGAAGLVDDHPSLARDHPLAAFLPADAGKVLVVGGEAGGWGPRSDPASIGSGAERACHVVVLDRVLSCFEDPEALFRRARELLADGTGRLLVMDAVQDSREWRRRVGGHARRDLDRALHAAGFFVHGHQHTDELEPVMRRHVAWRRSGSGRTTPPPLLPGDATTPRGRGHELWDLRPSPVSIRSYTPGNEDEIVPAFEEVFGAKRTMDHWRWKFAESPFGPTRVSSAWDGERLVAHYGGYVVPFWIDGELRPALHAGDTLIRPSHRGMGRGKRSLLAQMVRQFESQYVCGHVIFGYGFSTGTHLKLGRMFLGYHSPALVFVRTLEGDALDSLAAESRTAAWRRGFTVRRTRRVGGWADIVFRRARRSLGWQVARTREYLRWRYENDPDHDHEFFVVCEWGVPCGWWLGRVNGDTFELGDAMFRSRSHGAARAGMAALLRTYRHDGVELRRVTGWMSMVPDWWNRDLDAMGFARVQEENGIELIIKPCVADLVADDFTRNFYFTHGDSDMY